MDRAKLLDGGAEWFGPFEFNGQEMLETSQVTIPAHPDALQRMKGQANHPIIEEFVNEMLAEEPDGPADITKVLAAMKERINDRLDTIDKYLNDTRGAGSQPVDPVQEPAALTSDVFRHILQNAARVINGRK